MADIALEQVSKHYPGGVMAVERFDEQLVFEKVKAEYARLLSQKQRQVIPAEVCYE